MYLCFSWGFSLPHMVHQSHNFTSSITRAVRTQAEQWNSLFTNSTWKENLSLWNTKKVLSWAGRAILVEFSGPVMRCPGTLFKQSHSFPQLPGCWLLIAQSWNCSPGIAIGHNETLHQSYAPSREWLITNALIIERYNGIDYLLQCGDHFEGF